jgi:DNA-binding transcriptional ArsR family regulator
MAQTNAHPAAPGVAPAADGTPVPAAGTPGNPLRVTNPRMLRALAHPARLAILQFLVLEGPATATECAGVAGLSPSACSYHLRALAQYGFVEEDPESAEDGRQRPWRSRIISLSWGDEASTSLGMRVAGQMLEETLRSQADELRQRYLDRQSEYPAPWRQAFGLHNDVLHVTASELSALRERLAEVFGEFRRLNPSERPPGASRVHVMLDLTPGFEPDGAGQ